MMKGGIAVMLLLVSAGALAQNTFQKLYHPPGNGAHCFASYQLPDDGYIFTGIVSDGTDKVYLTRTDCEGNVLWSKSYNTSSTIGNISQRAIPLLDGGFALAASIGSYGSYNILVVRTDADGNTIWQKVMQGSGDDVVNSIVEAKNGDLVIAGHTSSFGQDSGSPYSDVYIARMDADGNYLWGKAIGTENAIDQAFDLVETADSSLVATGRCIEQGTFYAFVMKLDQDGELEFHKAYGDTLQYTAAYGIIEASGGGFALTGSTTVMKENFQSYPDEFIIRTDAQGDSLWTRTYHGTSPDHSENGSSIIEVAGGFAIAVATMSYPTSGFVPNKHVVLATDWEGNITKAKSFNSGGSHYPYITKPKDNVGLLLSGFTTNYSPANFKPLIIRTNDALESGCNETDLLSLTTMEYPDLQLRSPSYVVASGGSLIDSDVSDVLMWTDTMICSEILNPCNVESVWEGDGRTQPVLWYNPTTSVLHSASDCPFDGLRVTDAGGRRMDYLVQQGTVSFPELAAGCYVAAWMCDGAPVVARFVVLRQ